MMSKTKRKLFSAGATWLCLTALALSLVGKAEAVYYYTTYSASQQANGAGAPNQAYVHIFSINPSTTCYLYGVNTTGVDISTGTKYSSINMYDGQPFYPWPNPSPG